MFRRLALGGLFGGVVMFVWVAVSWITLPWHHTTLLNFSDEAAVAAIISDNAQQSGVYLLPNPVNFTPGADEAEQLRYFDDSAARMKQGPFVFASVKREGSDPDNPAPFILALVTRVVAALLMTGLVLLSVRRGYWRRVAFVTALGVLTGLMATFPNWNWWKFDSMFTLVNFADYVIQSLLAGLVIAGIAGDPPDSG